MDWCLLMLVLDAIVIAFIFAIDGMHFDHPNHVDVKLNVQLCKFVIFYWGEIHRLDVQCKRSWDSMQMHEDKKGWKVGCNNIVLTLRYLSKFLFYITWLLRNISLF